MTEVLTVKFSFFESFACYDDGSDGRICDANFQLISSMDEVCEMFLAPKVLQMWMALACSKSVLD